MRILLMLILLTQFCKAGSSIFSAYPQSKITRITTNNVFVIYVTGNSNTLVNGVYTNAWYNAALFAGVWTNTASTNIIYWGDTNETTVPWKLAGKTNASTYMFSSNQIYFGATQPKSTWDPNPLMAEGSDFSGYAWLSFGTNILENRPYTQLSRNTWWLTNKSANILYVTTNGIDALATANNGIPFKTLWTANQSNSSGGTIIVGPGWHTTYGFYQKPLTHIVGSGISNTFLTIEQDDRLFSPSYFQSRLISVTDGCSFGNMTITNACLGLTEYDGPVFGGTNQYVFSTRIYAPRYPKWSGDQATYWGRGVAISRVGTGAVFEKVIVYGGLIGFGFQSFLGQVTNSATMIDCEAWQTPEYAGGTNRLWKDGSFLWPETTGVGGMMPIAFTSGPGGERRSQFTLNIIRGKFVSLNGHTNAITYYNSSENQTSRNACIWISGAHTNTITFNITNASFIYGSTNAFARFMLNETTNNNVRTNGMWHEKRVNSAESEAFTNKWFFYGTNIYTQQ